MGNVLISLDDEAEKLLRKLAENRYANTKGSLSYTVKDALVDLDLKEKEEKRLQAVQNLIKIMDKGLISGYKMYKNRNEIYDD